MFSENETKTKFLEIQITDIHYSKKIQLNQRYIQKWKKTDKKEKQTDRKEN